MPTVRGDITLPEPASTIATTPQQTKSAAKLQELKRGNTSPEHAIRRR